MQRVICWVLALVSAVRAAPVPTSCSWWYEETAHHGTAFRNVSSFGAVGDGVADDTVALQAAIDSNRGGEPGSDQSKSAAVVYLGPGIYKVTDTIVLWKWTVLVGNPHCPPVIVLPAATPAFSGAKGLRPLLVSHVATANYCRSAATLLGFPMGTGKGVSGGLTTSPPTPVR